MVSLKLFPRFLISARRRYEPEHKRWLLPSGRIREDGTRRADDDTILPNF